MRRRRHCEVWARGAMTGEWFKAYVNEVLIPVLKPGDIVVIDNLSAH